MTAKSPLRLHRVAATFDFDPIPMAAGPSLTFRLEVLDAVPSIGRFTARLSRREHYRLQPSFALHDGVTPTQVDEVVVAEDVQDFWSEISGSSVEDVLSQVLAEFRARFGVE